MVTGGACIIRVQMVHLSVTKRSFPVGIVPPDHRRTRLIRLVFSAPDTVVTANTKKIKYSVYELYYAYAF